MSLRSDSWLPVTRRTTTFTSISSSRMWRSGRSGLPPSTKSRHFTHAPLSRHISGPRTTTGQRLSKRRGGHSRLRPARGDDVKRATALRADAETVSKPGQSRMGAVEFCARSEAVGRARLSRRFRGGIVVSSCTHVSSRARTQFLEVKGGERYAYRRFGSSSGLPLLLLQHFTGTLDNWDSALTDALAGERELILFDNAGIGRSSGSVPTTVAGMAKHAAAFLDGLGVGRATYSDSRWRHGRPANGARPPTIFGG